MMGLRKWLGLCEHDWSKWKFEEESWTNHQANGNSYNYHKQVQTRTCKTCGRIVREELVK